MIRERIKYLKPYEWAPSNKELSRMYGIPEDKIIRMDLNTFPWNPFDLIDELKDSIKNVEVNIYPDPNYVELRKKLADYCNVNEEQIVLTAGADEAIDIVVKAFLDPGSKAIISHPTYAYFRIPVEIIGGKPILVRRIQQNFRDNVKEILKEINEGAKLVFLCSPNNPTGNPVRSEDLIEILNTGITTIVDEVYYEFWGKTFAPLIQEFDNLVIIRSLSKAFGLAGARIGYIIAGENYSHELNKVRPPNSISILSIKLAETILDNLEIIKKKIQVIINERRFLEEELGKIKNIYAYPSKANFILLRTKNSGKIYLSLAKRGIILRNLSNIHGLADCLRVTISTPENNLSFLRCIREIVSQDNVL